MQGFRPLMALALGAALIGSGSIDARELAVPPESLLQAELAGIAALPDGSGAAVGLKLPDADQVVLIFIGVVEAAAIDRADQGVRPPRPMTHELLGDLLAVSEVRVLRLAIDQLRDGIYYAALEISDARGRRHWVDTRPSDGLVLAVRHDVPILLAPDVAASATDPGIAPAQAPRSTLAAL